ncbi:MAG: hypothetical protein AAF938_13985 [Myxococcota bacterium]
MFLRKAALRPIPPYAVVSSSAIEAVENTLDDDDEALQETLDRGYADMDRRQEALALYMAEKLALTGDELVQSLGYFLTITVYLAFRESFPTRLEPVAEDAIELADQMLSVDEELRKGDPTEILDSDDVLAMGQPAILSYIQHHVHEALEQSEGNVNVDQLDVIYRALLVLVIALSANVTSPTGEVPALD